MLGSGQDHQALGSIKAAPLEGGTNQAAQHNVVHRRNMGYHSKLGQEELSPPIARFTYCVPGSAGLRISSFRPMPA